MLGEEARAACDVEHPCRGQVTRTTPMSCSTSARPTGPLALRERPRAEPPVVLTRTLVKMRTHLIVHVTLRHPGDPTQANARHR